MLPRTMRAAAALCLVVALTGCLKVDLALTVEGETASGTFLTALDRDAIRLFGMSVEDVFDQPGDEDFADLDGVTTEPYEDDTWVGVTYTLDRVRLDDLNELSGDRAESPRILYDAQSDTYEFLLRMDLTDLDPDAGGEGSDLPIDLSALMDRFEARVAITFPGEVIEHNGELSGTTVTWSPQPGEDADMRAVARASGNGLGAPGRGSASSGAGPGVALVVALAALVLATALGLGLWLLLRNRRPATAAAAPAPAQVVPLDPDPTVVDSGAPPGDTRPASTPPGGGGQPG